MAVQLSAGDNSTCALLDDGQVRCWGARPGVPNGQYAIGDAPGDVPPPSVSLGGPALRLGDSMGHDKCVLMLDNSLRDRFVRGDGGSSAADDAAIRRHAARRARRAILRRTLDSRDRH